MFGADEMLGYMAGFVALISLTLYVLARLEDWLKQPMREPRRNRDRCK